MTRALLVVDIQNEYFPGGALPLYQSEQVEAGVISAIKRAAQAGDRIILVRHISNQATGGFIDGTFGAEIRPQVINASNGASVVTKHFADAFQDTTLLDHLEGIEELLICGMMTQNCVVFTALSRSAHPFKISILGDLCAAPTQLVHTIALSALRSKLSLVSSEDFWR